MYMKKITLAALLLLPWAGWQNVWGQTDGEGTGTETTTLTDVTSEYINDAGCSDLTKWTVVNSPAGNFSVNNWNGLATFGKDKDLFIECWRYSNNNSGHGVFDIHQTSKTLPQGKYRLSVSIVAVQQNSASNENFVKDVYLYVAGLQEPVHTTGQYKSYSIDFYADGLSATVLGVKNTHDQNFAWSPSGCNWFAMDDYRLEQYEKGTYDVSTDFAAMVSRAKAYKEEELSAGLWSKLKTVISEADKAADEAGKCAAMVKLQAVVSDADIIKERGISQRSVYDEAKAFYSENPYANEFEQPKYETLGNALEAYETYDGSGYTKLEELGNEINTAYGIYKQAHVVLNENYSWKVGTWYKDGGRDVAGYQNNSSPVDGDTSVPYDERWASGAPAGGTEMIYQVINGLPAGNYTVKADAFGCRSYEDGGNWNNWDMNDGKVKLYFFANNKQTENFADRYVRTRELSTVEVGEDGTLRIGIKSAEDNNGGNWVGVVRNSVLIEYEGESKVMLTALISQASGLEAAAETDVAKKITAAQAVVDNTDADQASVNKAYADLEKAILLYKAVSATNASPVNMSSLVRNPSGEGGNTGWYTDVVGDQFKSMDVRDEMRRALPYTKSKYYQNYAEQLPRNTRIIYQVITGLPVGYYKVSMCAFARNMNGNYRYNQVPTGVYAFANEGETYVRNAYMEEIEVIGQVGEGSNTLVLGLKTKDDETVRWTGLGNVSLQYLGTEKPAQPSNSYVAIKDYERTGMEGWNTDYAGKAFQICFLARNYDKHLGDFTGSHIIELFHGDTFTPNKRVAYQTVEGLEPGIYTVSADVLNCNNGDSNNPKGQVYLYGNAQYAVVKGDGQLHCHSVDCVVGEDGKLEFGVRTGITQLENTNWIGIADVKVEKKGEAVGVTLDEASEASVTGTQTNVLCNRTLKAGVWNTLCLPYEINDLSRFTAVYELSSLKKIEGMATSYTIGFSKTESKMEAGQPYIVKVDADTQLFEASADMASDVAGSKEVTVADGVKAQMIGAYSPVTVAANQDNYVFATDNKFYYMDKDTQMKGYRAYIHLDNGTTGEPASLIFSLDEDDIQTGVVPVADVRTGEERVNVYSISGVRVREGVKSAEALNSLPSGIYIVNGKKYMVK